MHLLDFFKRFKLGFVIATGLIVIEYVAWIVEPSLFGTLIDALIDKDAEIAGVSTTWPLALWIGVFALNSTVGAIRRSVDERIFLRMFAEIATDVAHVANKHNLSVSRTTARAQLAREFIYFFQYRMPDIFEQVITIGGALVALYFLDYRIALACLVVVVPLLLINLLYNSRVIVLQTQVHDSIEDAHEIFATRDPKRVHEYYTALARTQQKIANWGALTFGGLRLVLLLIFLVVLYIAIDLDNFSAGEIYSIAAYIWAFVTSSEYLPEMMESYTSLKDISRRLKQEPI